MSSINGASSQDRKNVPLYSGLMKYFPDALVEVAKLSKWGNDKHNPGQPLHWAKGKSTDHDDCVARHLLDAGSIDPESGFRHRVGMAWRALAALQTEIEEDRRREKTYEAAAVELFPGRKNDRRVDDRRKRYDELAKERRLGPGHIGTREGAGSDRRRNQPLNN